MVIRPFSGQVQYNHSEIFHSYITGEEFQAAV